MLYNLFENRDFVSVFAVALLAEGGDRNPMLPVWLTPHSGSPSSRRAGIEIQMRAASRRLSTVALLAEGGDRNYVAEVLPEDVEGRPPRGGRG